MKVRLIGLAAMLVLNLTAAACAVPAPASSPAENEQMETTAGAGQSDMEMAGETDGEMDGEMDQNEVRLSGLASWQPFWPRCSAYGNSISSAVLLPMPGSTGMDEKTASGPRRCNPWRPSTNRPATAPNLST